MLILVINSGSSSIKYQLFKMSSTESRFMCKGLIERIGQGRSRATHANKDSQPRRISADVKNHKAGVKLMIEALTAPRYGAIDSVSKLGAVGHRVVHGGEKFKKPVVITGEVIRYIEKYSELAPLHNPPALAGIKAARDLLPDIPQVAVFDTAFHADMPPHAYLYALPYEQYKKYKIRRYGFHGTSHHYVALEASRILRRPLKRLKLITCHLGNGCSIAAIKDGKSVDTSMGFTPLEGLVMGTRCGDMDPAIVFYLMKKESLDAQEISQLLNKKSGLLGISGTSNDMRDLLKEKEAGNKRAQLALEVFLYRIKKYIGAYMAVLNGADAIVLTAGIGENNPFIKERIIKELSLLIKGCRTRILVIATNEELMIARETYHALSDK